LGKKELSDYVFQSMVMQQKWDEIINFDYIINVDRALEMLEI